MDAKNKVWLIVFIGERKERTGMALWIKLEMSLNRSMDNCQVNNQVVQNSRQRSYKPPMCEKSRYILKSQVGLWDVGQGEGLNILKFSLEYQFQSLSGTSWRQSDPREDVWVIQGKTKVEIRNMKTLCKFEDF